MVFSLDIAANVSRKWKTEYFEIKSENWSE